MNTNYRAVISSAWAGMLGVLVAMLLVDPLRHAMAGTYAELSQTLAADPGEKGLVVLLVMLCMNTLVQVAVHTVTSTRSRTVIFVLSTLYGVFFLIHQVVHLVGGEGLSLHTALDVTHHVLAATAIWASWRWRKSAA
jgi:hypothetical protein